jgi:hypothetical protein
MAPGAVCVRRRPGVGARSGVWSRAAAPGSVSEPEEGVIPDPRPIPRPKVSRPAPWGLAGSAGFDSSHPVGPCWWRPRPT